MAAGGVTFVVHNFQKEGQLVIDGGHHVIARKLGQPLGGTDCISDSLLVFARVRLNKWLHTGIDSISDDHPWWKCEVLDFDFRLFFLIEWELHICDLVARVLLLIVKLVKRHDPAVNDEVE